MLFVLCLVTSAALIATQLELHPAQLALPAQWKDIQQLPYLDAVIREAVRYSPGIAMVLERKGPPGGMHLPDGRHVPERTKGRVNPAVTNRNREMFGSDADEWNADRCVRRDGEAEDEYKVRLGRMKDVSDFTFGGGNRACMGKSLARMEMYKFFDIISSLYDVSTDKRLTMGLARLLFADACPIRSSWLIPSMSGRIGTRGLSTSTICQLSLLDGVTESSSASQRLLFSKRWASTDSAESLQAVPSVPVPLSSEYLRGHDADPMHAASTAESLSSGIQVPFGS